MIVTEMNPSRSGINWHARTLAEVFAISLLGVIIFYYHTQVSTMQYTHPRELAAERCNALRLSQQLFGSSGAALGIENANRDLTPDPGMDLSPAEKRAIELSVPEGRWTE